MLCFTILLDIHRCMIVFLRCVLVFLVVLCCILYSTLLYCILFCCILLLFYCILLYSLFSTILSLFYPILSHSVPFCPILLLYIFLLVLLLSCYSYCCYYYYIIDVLLICVLCTTVVCLLHFYMHSVYKFKTKCIHACAHTHTSISMFTRFAHLAADPFGLLGLIGLIWAWYLVQSASCHLDSWWLSAAPEVRLQWECAEQHQRWQFRWLPASASTAGGIGAPALATQCTHFGEPAGGPKEKVIGCMGWRSHWIIQQN